MNSTKPKTAADALALIKDLPPTEREKLFDALWLESSERGLDELMEVLATADQHFHPTNAPQC